MLFTFPSRYWSTIGLWRVFSLGGWSRRIHTGFHVPRATQEHRSHATDTSDTGLSPSADRLSRLFSSRQTHASVRVLQPPRGRNLTGLGCAPFARHYWGYHCCFLFLRVLRCFSSPRSPPCLKQGFPASSREGCPIRTSADQWLHAPPRGFSQLAASFIAFQSQGIRHAPFLSFAAAPSLLTGGYNLRQYPNTAGVFTLVYSISLGSPFLGTFLFLFQYVK